MIDRKEIIRYLGYKGEQPGQDILDLIEVCVAEVEAAAVPKHVCRRFPVRVTGETVAAAGLTFYSKRLATNLKDCAEVVFFAATLGVGVDRLLQKYLKLQVSKAVVVQAVAAAAMEGYCNQCQKELEASCAEEGLFVRPRYSPGYGDLELAVQGEFLQVLQAHKTVGIVLTEGDIMLPEKSVTAIMGLSPVRTACHREGCEMCGNVNCAYRRI
ncbi:MAG: Vitamin B12 dependent methionine synthase activation subunit [Lachnospiraceae bacterium]|nr:Vitamin B12 dependent methionine synthase activation subunit [Lachnospiraceae bacterium]